MIYKPARAEIVDGKRRVISKHKQWYVSDTEKDFHTQHGMIPKGSLHPGVVEAGNERFYVVPAQFIDEYKRIRRKAQIITLKDLGFISAHCGVTPDDVIVESGAGSGGATAYFARLCNHVFSYERDDENIRIVTDNLRVLDLSNVTIANADFYEPGNVGEHDASLVLLDLPEPWRAWESIRKATRLGGHIVAYTPTIVQAQLFVNEMPEWLMHDKTLEVIQRDWKIVGRAVRPSSTSIGHTAFLTFARRIQ